MRASAASVATSSRSSSVLGLRRHRAGLRPGARDDHEPLPVPLPDGVPPVERTAMNPEGGFRVFPDPVVGDELAGLSQDRRLIRAGRASGDLARLARLRRQHSIDETAPAAVVVFVDEEVVAIVQRQVDSLEPEIVDVRPVDRGDLACVDRVPAWASGCGAARWSTRTRPGSRPHFAARRPRSGWFRGEPECRLPRFRPE